MLRQMQGLTRIVTEKIIFTLNFCNGRSVYQIGMEHQSVPLGLIGLCFVFHIDNLTGRNKDQGSFLIIIVMASVFYIAALHVFQDDAINAKIHFLSSAYFSL